jgi:hypothetical protein
VAHADLRYTTHVEVRAQAQTTKDPRVAAMMRIMMPPGDTVTFLGGDAIRIEQATDGKKVVILLRADGQTLLDPDARTYTRIPRLGDVLKQAASQPTPTFRRTGDFATIHGLRAERVEVTMPVTLPVVPPAGLPTVVTMTGEIWLSAAFRTLGAGVQKAVGFTAPLPSGLEGMVLRQILRSVEFGYEVESNVTELSDSPIAPAMFTIPKDYREVSPFSLR